MSRSFAGLLDAKFIAAIVSGMRNDTSIAEKEQRLSKAFNTKIVCVWCEESRDYFPTDHISFESMNPTVIATIMNSGYNTFLIPDARTVMVFLST
jgi:hypothetical protein